MPTPAKYAVSLFIAAGIFLAGYMANRQPVPVVTSASVNQAIYYTCPMHPQYKSDHPGECPVCGMSLVPMSAGNARTNANPVNKELPGMMQISAEKQQLIGVRTEEVRRDRATQMLRVPGRITVDDQRLYRVVAATDGWIRELGQNTPGSFIRQNEILATYYTTNFVASQQTFLYALQTIDSTPRGTPSPDAQRYSPNLNLQIAIFLKYSDFIGVKPVPFYKIDKNRIKIIATRSNEFFFFLTHDKFCKTIDLFS